VEESQALSERWRPVTQAILRDSGLTRVTEAMGRSIFGSVSPSLLQKLGTLNASGTHAPLTGFFTPNAVTPDLTYALAGVDVGAPQRRQLESLERLGASISDLVAIVTDDAAAARADAKESDRSARHSRIMGWCGIAVAVIIGVVTIFVTVRHGG
jgi:hypothetical protein